MGLCCGAIRVLSSPAGYFPSDMQHQAAQFNRNPSVHKSSRSQLASLPWLIIGLSFGKLRCISQVVMVAQAPTLNDRFRDMAHVSSLALFCLTVHHEKLVCVKDIIVCNSGNMMSWGVLSACIMGFFLTV